jgi:signal peptidase II
VLVTDPDAEAPSAGRPSSRGRLVAIVALVTVVLDQITKEWAVRALDDDRIIHVLGSFQLNLVYNPGSAFSFGRGIGPVLGVVALVMVFVLGRLGRHVTSPLVGAALGLVIGGAVGNLIDRLVREGGGGLLGGYVIDFFDLQWWPVFNVADIGITVGAVLLAFGWGRGEAAEADAGPSAP